MLAWRHFRTLGISLSYWFYYFSWLTSKSTDDRRWTVVVFAVERLIGHSVRWLVVHLFRLLGVLT